MDWFYSTIALSLVLLLICKLIFKYTTGVCKSNVRLDNKTVVITGSDKGIGYETTLDLAGRGARIVMACRDVDNAKKMAMQITKETGNAEIVVMKIDLSSLSSVKQFAAELLEKEARLDILINNAGMPCDVVKTEDGFEKVFVVNYLGHFLLTHLLLGVLKKSSPSRVVNVSSLAYIYTFTIKPSNINLNSYSLSKALQILHASEFTRLHKESGVIACSLHPGLIYNKNFISKLKNFLFYFIYLAYPFMKSSKEGAQTTIHAAVDTGVVGGGFYIDCAAWRLNALCSDEALAKKVYEVSERHCGIA